MTDHTDAPAQPDAFSLEGRRIAITGAARGLGAAAAVAVAAAGATVMLGARQPGAAAEVVDRIRRAGGEARAISLDVTSTASVDAFFEDAAGDEGLDGLVNNAGVAHGAFGVDLDDEAWLAVLDVNLTGTFRCCRAFLRVANGGAAVANLASFGALVGVPSESAYTASKGGVVALTRTLALEATRQGVRVNALAPGYLRTDMPAAVLDDPEARRRLVERIPMRRIAEPEEIGPPLVFLLAAASAYMTGAVVPFDGGLTAK